MSWTFPSRSPSSVVPFSTCLINILFRCVEPGWRKDMLKRYLWTSSINTTYVAPLLRIISDKFLYSGGDICVWLIYVVTKNCLVILIHDSIFLWNFMLLESKIQIGIPYYYVSWYVSHRKDKKKMIHKRTATSLSAPPSAQTIQSAHQ